MGRAQSGQLGHLLASEPLKSLARLGGQCQVSVALVGGAVRDCLMCRSVADLDLVVEGDLGRYLGAIEGWLGRRPAWIGDRFQQTHRFRRAGYQVDVAAAQGSLTEDLSRRDFTINAMAVPLDRGAEARILDPHGGRADLQRTTLRATGTGVLAADPLRVLRAVRYRAQLQLRVDPDTRAGLVRHSPELANVAVERVVAEWQAILRGDRWRPALHFADEVGALVPTLGDLGEAAAVSALKDREAGWTLRLAAVAFDRAAVDGPAQAHRALQEMRWPLRSLRRAFRTAAWAAALPGSELTQWIDWILVDESAARDAAALAEMLFPGATGAVAGLRAACERAGVRRWVTGTDLEAWGMPSGPALGAILEQVARGQIGGRWGSVSEARAWARQQVRALAAEAGS